MNGTMVPFGRWNSSQTNGSYQTMHTPGDRYQWVFWYFWLIITVSLVDAWLIGAYGVRVDAQHNYELR